MKYWLVKKDNKYLTNEIGRTTYWSKNIQKAFRFDNKNFAAYCAINYIGRVVEVRTK